MYKIFEYSKRKFQFKKIFESKLKSELETLHEAYNFDTEPLHFVGGNLQSKIVKNKINIFDFTENFYSDILHDKNFIDSWNNFTFFVKENIFNNQNIYIQKFPSIKIIPSNSKIKYLKETTYIFNRENNWHLDNIDPFWHPPFEKNFWISLIKTDKDNTLYVQDDDIVPMLLDEGQLLMFDDVYHGAFVHNRSSLTRISIDFKAFPVKDYNTNMVSEKLVRKRGKLYKQNEWYSEKYYYKKI